MYKFLLYISSFSAFEVIIKKNSHNYDLLCHNFNLYHDDF